MSAESAPQNSYCDRGGAPGLIVKAGLPGQLTTRVRLSYKETNIAHVEDAYICDGVRSPFGRYGGPLAGVRADDLAAVPLRQARTIVTSREWRCCWLACPRRSPGPRSIGFAARVWMRSLWHRAP